MLNLSRLIPERFIPTHKASFDSIPQLSGGACLAYPRQWRTNDDHTASLQHVQDVAHGLFQKSVTHTPGSVFLFGIPESEIKQRYPMAQELKPAEKIGRVSMSPQSAMVMLRNLLGDREMKPYLWDLFYLEQAGNELSKPGPLAMIPEWVEDQLKVETMAAAICGMQRHDATVGAAIRALMQQGDFSFSMLDDLQEDAQAGQGALSPKVSKALERWSGHAAEIVAALRRLLDDPPAALRYLPAVREAQEGRPGVYYFPESVMADIAPVLDAVVLSGGLRDAHHWYVDLPALGDYHTDGFNAAARLGAALWQAREAREAGFGPSVWWDIGGEVPEQSGTRSYQHRCVQGSSFIVGYADQVLSGLQNALGVEISMDDPVSDKSVSVGRVTDQAFRHLHSEQEKAAQLYGYAPEPRKTPKPPTEGGD